ncbi:laminin subunit alpha-2-like [Glandiceps talaboti]
MAAMKKSKFAVVVCGGAGSATTVSDTFIWRMFCVYVLFLFFLPSHCQQQDVVNVALNKPVLAVHTCGSPKESFSAHSEGRKPSNLQVVEECDAQNPDLWHPPRYMVDGDPNTWWQSTSKMNLNQLGQINPDSVITLELQQNYYVESISLSMGDSARPGQMGVFKSQDGLNFIPWMYQVSTIPECQSEFQVEFNLDVTSVTSVLCQTYGSPALPKNEMVSFIPATPALEFKEWSNAKYIQFRFYDMDRTYGFLSDVYHHYTVTEIEVLAKCVCSGHASSCDRLPLSDDPSKETFQCVCGGNTQGFSCQECQHFYNQLPYQVGDEGFQCEACNCFDHSDSCYYDPNVALLKQSIDINGNYSGGGVCVDCRNNTAGYNCQRCREFYYRALDKVQTDEDACQPCDCFLPGTREDMSIGLFRGHCVMNNDTARPYGMMPGDCFCKVNVEGNKCDVCKDGFYDLSATHVEGCLDCECNIAGTIDNSTNCNKTTGQCSCKTYAVGSQCGECMNGYAGLSISNPDGCSSCDCNIGGSTDESCNKETGQCICWNNIVGSHCDSVDLEAYFPEVHFINAEFESVNHPNWERDDVSNPGYFWYGYVVLTTGDSTTTTLTIPTGTRFSGQYELMLHYSADIAATVVVTAIQLDTIPPVSVLSSDTLSQCPDSWCYQSLANSGVVGEVFSLDSGDWLITVEMSTSSATLLLDQIVALPVEFLNLENLLGASVVTQFDVDCDVRDNDMNSTGNIDYCIDQIFTMTSYYMQGGLPCDCNLIGSYNNLCNFYGGQCACKPNVGGRRCDMCLPEFYLFSTTGCKACECFGDNKVCNMLTGQCECPPNTVGRQCDRCVTYTYGLNSTTGCQPCDCDVVGSSNLQCDAETGDCACQPGVGNGDGKCEGCQDGYKHYTELGCQLCDCDPDGSITDVCNKTTGQCVCKDNVEGLQCDTCKAGTFFNDEVNPSGCLECVCMGITSQCSSSTLKNVMYSIPTNGGNLDSWQVVEDTSGNTPAPINATVATINGSPFLSLDLLGTQPTYWLLTSLNGNLLGSYGSSLTFTLHFESTVAGTPTPSPIVYLEGFGNRYIHILEPLVNNVTKTYSIMIAEWDWRIETTNGNITRQDFMKTLTDITKVLFPATLFNAQHLSSIGIVSYYKATDRGLDYDPMADDAYAVEKCECGPEYAGSSCEECAMGYHRSNQSIHDYFGVCVPCECNGHTEECDMDTGECLNCQHSTTGFNCELCADGYYGDATQGTATDCLQCPCPQPKTLTSLCASIEGVVTCLNCSDGHIGPLCDQCEVFYFGQPDQPDGFCQRCECNGNSNDCNEVTGECLNCESDTTGFNCERCIDGKFGNASLQNCQDCACNPIGSSVTLCDHESGQCTCHPGVEGRQCDSCQENFFGFNDGNGCDACECNPYGSFSLQCGDTGICQCKAGLGLGDKCDQCPNSKWGLPNRQCEDCNCDPTGTNQNSLLTCDLISGQCECKTGVGGRACDQCLPTWVGFSFTGCTECNQCTKILYTAVTDLQTSWDTYYYLASWLGDLQDRDRELQSLMDTMNTSISELRQQQTTFVELRETVNTLDASVYTLQVDTLNNRMEIILNRVNTLLQTSESQMNRIVTIRDDAVAAYDAVNAASLNAVQYVDYLTKWNESSTEMLDSIENVGGSVSGVNFDEQLLVINTELAKCQNASSDADTFRQTVETQAVETNRLESLVNSAQDEFTAMQSLIAETNRILATATTTLIQANEILNETQSQVEFSQSLVLEVQTTLSNIDTILTTSSSDILTAGKLFDDALLIKNGGTSGSAPVDSSINQQGFNGWTSALAATQQQNTEVSSQQPTTEAFVSTAETQASTMYSTATETLRVFQGAQVNGQPAVDAIDSYNQAITTLNEATEKALEANTTIAEALNFIKAVSLDKIQEDAVQSQIQSDELKTMVDSRTVDPNSLLLRLAEASGSLTAAQDTWAEVETSHADLQLEASTLQQKAVDPAVSQLVIEGTTTANSAISNANQVISASTSLNTQVLTNQQQVTVIQQSVTNATIMNQELVTLVPRIESELDTVISNVATIQDVSNRTDYLRSDITSKLALLQKKLEQVQQAVANSKQPVHFSARSSMQFARGHPEESYLFNEVSMNVKAETKSGLLFYTENYDNSALMGLEVVDGYPVFRYNLGQDLVSVQSPVDICCNEWYEILATRYGYEGRLSVKSIATGGASMNYEKSVVTYQKYLGLGLSSLLYVGGLPLDYQLNRTKDAPPDITSAVNQLEDSSIVETMPIVNRDFVGCLANVKFDDQELNLWQPDYQEGVVSCCNRPVIDTTPEAITPGVSFNGFGYLELPMQEFTINTNSIMSVEFRTWMTNAVLLLVNRQDIQPYMGLFIANNKVVFEFTTVTNVKKTLETIMDYNDAKWYKATGGFNSSHVFLEVAAVDSGSVETYTMPLSTSVTFNLLQFGPRLFVGSGVTESVNRGPTNFKFAGCMRNLMLSNGTSEELVLRPMTNETAVSYYDVSFTGCLAEVVPGIGFEDSQTYTYVRMTVGSVLSSTEKIEFQFKTMENSGMLAYSYDDTSFNKLFYITLFHGNIFVQYNIGEGISDPLQTTNLRLNDGQWHDVKIEFNGLAATLKVDSNPTVASNRQLNTDNGISISGFLYLGGVPSTIPVLIGGEFPIRDSFIGNINGFALNDEEFEFNNPNIVSEIRQIGLILSGVPPQIAQLPPLPYTTVAPQPGTPLPLTCASPVSVVESATGLRFGMKGNSYVTYTLDEISKQNWQASFVINVQFRATSPNGLIFYAAQSYQNPVTFMALHMIDGALSFNIMTSSRVLTGLDIRTKFKYNTGELIEVYILRINDFVAIMVPRWRDYKNNEESSNKPSALNIETPLFIGGLSDSVIDPPVERLGFDGCIISVQVSTDGPIDPVLFDMSAPTTSENTGKCTENKVTAGAFMEGSGYMILENNFEVGSKLKIKMMIRTTIRNALLLAVARDISNFFTLDISEGKVRAVVSHGLSSPYIVQTSSLTSEYVICNNQPHMLTVSMTTEGLEISIDEYPPDVFLFNSGIPVVDTNDPVYVGGLPGNEQTKIVNGIRTESFSGCIQSLEINQVTRDLRLPVASVAVQSGCPLPL